MSFRGSGRRPHLSSMPSPSFSLSSTHGSLYRKLAYAFLLLTVIIFLSVLWLSTVQATVDIRAERTSVRADQAIEIQRVPQSGQIPGRILQTRVRRASQEFEVKGAGEAASSTASATKPNDSVAQATTTKPQPNATSSTASSSATIVRGEVTIVNNYSKPQTLVRTTRLLTPEGKLFRLDKQVVVPAGGQVTAPVYADKAGLEYLIGPSKFTIPGLWVDLQTLIYAETKTGFQAKTDAGEVINPTQPEPVTPAPTTGTGAKVVTSQNIDEAHGLLFDLVVEQAKRSLAAEVGDARLNGSAYFVKILNKEASVRPGQTARTFTAGIEVEVTGVFYSMDDMQALIRNRLKEKLPEGREFLPFNEKNIVYTLESADASAEQAKLRVVADAEYRLTSSVPGLDKGEMTGRTAAEVTEKLKQIDGVNEVTVQMKPSWLRKLPSLKDHITVNIR